MSQKGGRHIDTNALPIASFARIRLNLQSYSPTTKEGTSS
jgi:hypothetical protein